MKSSVALGKGYWLQKTEYFAREIIPYQFHVLNDSVPHVPKSHSIENYRIAAGLSDGTHEGMLFQDSDLTKWLEAASYSLHTVPSAETERRIEDMGKLLSQAMEPDGYLDTYYQCNGLPRFTNLAHGHELYCLGHLIEAATAHYEETGKTCLLSLAQRAADLLCQAIGKEEGQKDVYSGHPEIETALFALHRATGNAEYARLACRMLDARGAQPSFLLTDDGYQQLYTGHWYDLSYHQAHAPIRQQRTAEGHAVRAVYLYRAMAEQALFTGDPSLQETLRALWQNICQRRMYVTGGIGSEAHGERFSLDYDLPGDRAYAETCASIGMFLWARRMLDLDPLGEYADMMEWELYNSILAGVSADGKRYFYVNPLAVRPKEAAFRFDLSHVKSARVEWFGCACCPPNVTRLLLSLYKHIFRGTEDGLAVDLFISALYARQGEPRWTLHTDYPQNGLIALQYEGASPSTETLRLRIPAWCAEYALTLNGKPVEASREKGYAAIRRRWQKGDTLQLILDLLPRFLRADPRAPETIGKICLSYGPMVYCFEEADNGDDLHRILLNPGARIQKDDVLSQVLGLPCFTSTGEKLLPAKGLYTQEPLQKEVIHWKAVPYHLWGNRQKGEMRVWMQEK